MRPKKSDKGEIYTVIADFWNNRGIIPKVG